MTKRKHLRILRPLPENETTAERNHFSSLLKVLHELNMELKDTRRPLVVREAQKRLLDALEQLHQAQDNYAERLESYKILKEVYKIDSGRKPYEKARRLESKDAKPIKNQPSLFASLNTCPAWCSSAHSDEDPDARLHYREIGCVYGSNEEMPDIKYEIEISLDSFEVFDEIGGSIPPAVCIRIHRDPIPEKIDSDAITDLDPLYRSILAASTASGYEDRISLVLDRRNSTQLAAFLKSALVLLSN